MTPARLERYGRWRPSGYKCVAIQDSRLTNKILRRRDRSSRHDDLPPLSPLGHVDGFLILGLRELALRYCGLLFGTDNYIMRTMKPQDNVDGDYDSDSDSSFTSSKHQPPPPLPPTSHNPSREHLRRPSLHHSRHLHLDSRHSPPGPSKKIPRHINEDLLHATRRLPMQPDFLQRQIKAHLHTTIQEVRPKHTLPHLRHTPPSGRLSGPRRDGPAPSRPRRNHQPI